MSVSSQLNPIFMVCRAAVRKHNTIILPADEGDGRQQEPSERERSVELEQ